MLLKKQIKTKLNTFIILYSIFTALTYNFLFYSRVYERNSNIIFVGGCFVVLSVLLVLCCQLLFWKYTTKPLSILLLLINSSVLYFMLTYKISIDKVMIQNVLETDVAEVRDLLSLKLFVYIFTLGIIPSALIYKTTIIYPKPLKLALNKFLVILVSLLIIFAIVLPNYKNVSQFVRNNRSLKYSIVPVNYIADGISMIREALKEDKELIIIGEDAIIKPYWKNNGKKNLFVFVVGETARAKNFSLGGYEKDTNKPLEKYGSDIIYSDMNACGTATTISVPCMFSKYDRKSFKNGSGAYNENFLDILQRAGYKVTWYDNNSGCKGNCRRVETVEVCKKVGECQDDKMTTMFSKQLETLNKDAFIVLHQIGSHGPTYYKRYPEEMAKYKPSCKTEQLDKCSQEEVVNVYDNTIYYTSHNLAQTIEELKKVSDKFNTVLIYASDHGESLGEKGLYLHGAPYIIAPDEQTIVPFLIWMSDETANNLNLDKNCLKGNLSKEISHDNLFHSMLGLTGTSTKERNPNLDIFAGCIKND